MRAPKGKTWPSNLSLVIASDLVFSGSHLELSLLATSAYPLKSLATEPLRASARSKGCEVVRQAAWGATGVEQQGGSKTLENASLRCGPSKSVKKAHLNQDPPKPWKRPRWGGPFQLVTEKGKRPPLEQSRITGGVFQKGLVGFRLFQRGLVGFSFVSWCRRVSSVRVQ